MVGRIMVAAVISVLSISTGGTCAYAEEECVNALQEPVKRPEAEKAAEVPAAQSAESKKAPEAPVVEMKELEGQISGLGGNFIAISYGGNAETSLEAAFNVAPNVQMSHKRSFKELKFGDTVRVRFEQTSQKLENGRTFRKNTVKSIAFLKAAPKETSTDALVTPPEQAQAESSLSLKGIKGR